MRSAARYGALLVILLSVTVAFGQSNGGNCSTRTIWPYPTDAVCQGNGQCVDGVCICNEGFIARSEFFVVENGCVTYQPARTGMNSLLFACPLVIVPVVIYRLFTLRPLVIGACLRRERRPKYAGGVPVLEWICLSALVLWSGICVNGGIFLFDNTYMHANLFSVIVSVISEFLIIVNCGLLCYLFMRLCLISIRLEGNQKTLLSVFAKTLAANSIISGMSVVVGHIGSYAAYPDFEAGFAFGRVYTFGVAASTYAYSFIIALFSQLLLNSLNEHLQSEIAKSNTSVLTLNQAVSRLRKLRLLGTGMLGCTASSFMLSGILPALQAYTRGIVACMLTLGHCLIVYFIPPQTAKQKGGETTSFSATNSGSANSGSAVSI